MPDLPVPVEAMKRFADDENEILDVTAFQDEARNVITPVVTLPGPVMQALADALIAIVRAGHDSPVHTAANDDGIVRAQTFEEGDVFMLEAPFDGYFADRYLMDFYDVGQRGICSRMHLHTGLRFVRMITGPDTVIRVSSLSPFVIKDRVSGGVQVPDLAAFVDLLPDTPEGYERVRYNVTVPANSMVDMQVPRGTSHQFNAIGPNAVIDSVHPEESIETFRERMSGYKMMAQTLFLAEHLPTADTCLLSDAAAATG